MVSEKRREQVRAWRAKNPEKVQAHQAKNPQVKSAIQACSRAKEQKISFDREYLSALPCPECCPILGTPISFERGKGQRPRENTASFDQIVPGCGYVPGNVRIISQLANTMLDKATAEQRYAMGLWLVAEYETQPTRLKAVA